MADGQGSDDLWLPDDVVAVISMTYELAVDFMDMTADRRVWTDWLTHVSALSR